MGATMNNCCKQAVAAAERLLLQASEAAQVANRSMRTWTKRALDAEQATGEFEELYESERLFREAQEERLRSLVEALIQHRADLHAYSTRPCPTCRRSAEALGIAELVPNACADEREDGKALAAAEALAVVRKEKQ